MGFKIGDEVKIKPEAWEHFKKIASLPNMKAPGKQTIHQIPQEGYFELNSFPGYWWQENDIMFDTDPHPSHCCKAHGCKYNDGDDCTVLNGKREQDYPCGNSYMCEPMEGYQYHSDETVTPTSEQVEDTDFPEEKEDTRMVQKARQSAINEFLGELTAELQKDAQNLTKEDITAAMRRSICSLRSTSSFNDADEIALTRAVMDLG